MLTYDYIIITMMGYEHNKNKYNVRECVFGLIWNIGYAIFYYKLLLFTTDFKWFFMCGQIIVICNGGVRGRGRGEGRVVVEAVPLIFYI